MGRMIGRVAGAAWEQLVFWLSVKTAMVLPCCCNGHKQQREAVLSAHCWPVCIGRVVTAAEGTVFVVYEERMLAAAKLGPRLSAGQARKLQQELQQNQQ